MLGSSVDLTNHFPKRITGVIFELQVVMMGNPAEAGAMGGAGSYPSQQQQQRQQARTIGYPNVSYYKNNKFILLQKATFPGLTAMVGVIALIADIISVAVPHWGYYSPGGVGFYQSGEKAKAASWVRGKLRGKTGCVRLSFSGGGRRGRGEWRVEKGGGERASM